MAIATQIGIITALAFSPDRSLRLTRKMVVLKRSSRGRGGASSVPKLTNFVPFDPDRPGR
jgi:hypothetical protein